MTGIIQKNLQISLILTVLPQELKAKRSRYEYLHFTFNSLRKSFLILSLKCSLLDFW